MHPLDQIARWGCAMMIALYASNLVAGLERAALAATHAERLLHRPARSLVNAGFGNRRNPMWDWLKGKKTYIVAIGGIVGAWWGVYTGTVAPAEAINVTYEGLIGMTIRHGVASAVDG